MHWPAGHAGPGKKERLLLLVELGSKWVLYDSVKLMVPGVV